MEARVVVECDEPHIRAALMGLIANLLKTGNVSVETKPLEQQEEHVRIAMENSVSVLEALGQSKDLQVTVAEQFVVPHDFVNALFMANKRSAESHVTAHGDLKISPIQGVYKDGEFTEMDVSELGISASHIGELIEHAHNVVISSGAFADDEDGKIEAIKEVASKAIKDYIESIVPGAPVHIIPIVNKTADGYTFSAAIAIDKEKIVEYLERRRKEKGN